MYSSTLRENTLDLLQGVFLDFVWWEFDGNNAIGVISDQFHNFWCKIKWTDIQMT